MEDQICNLMEIIHHHQCRCSGECIDHQPSSVGWIGNGGCCKVGCEIRVAHAGKPISNGFKERPGAFPILTAVVQKIASVYKLFNQFRSHGRLANTSDARHEQCGGAGVQEIDHVVQFRCSAVEVTKARQICQRCNQLLFDMFGEVSLNQFFTEVADVQHTLFVHVPDDVNRAHFKRQDGFGTSQRGVLCQLVVQHASKWKRAKPLPCFVGQSNASIGQEVGFSFSRDAFDVRLTFNQGPLIFQSSNCSWYV